jgi:hypothetical protein
MSDDRRHPFWTTLPGLLTGVAALLTALTGIYVAVDRSRESQRAVAPQSEAPARAVSAAPASTTESPPTSSSEALAAVSVVLFNNGNKLGVLNGPIAPTRFTIDRRHRIDDIRTYHWNDRVGASPGTIALLGADGTRYGPWEASGSSGQDGVPNVNWMVSPAITIPAGTYTIVDSEPATWSHNADSGNAGFAVVRGRPVQQ